MTGKSLPVHVDAALCRKCGGKCCKRGPGITHPDDWGAPVRIAMRLRLTRAFASGLYAIDYWEGDPRKLTPKVRAVTYGYFVRPASVEYRTKRSQWGVRECSWGGSPCVLLGSNGCLLPHDSRPYQCRSLRPGKDDCVFVGIDKQALAVAWIPYHDVIERAEQEAAALMSVPAVVDRMLRANQGPATRGRGARQAPAGERR